MADNRPRLVKLLCPSLSKIVPMVAWDDQKIDLGSIARLFGLDPSTLKLNGHFISRGVDFISSSVTWKSLFSFFSAKGLSTGKDYHDALIVAGKLSKVDKKRSHDPQNAVNWICGETDAQDVNTSRLMNLEALESHRDKRLRQNIRGDQLSHDIGLKRKQLSEDISLLKKLKINENHSDCQVKGNGFPSNIPCTPYTCSYVSKNAKRIRGDEAIVAAPCKRIR